MEREIADPADRDPGVALVLRGEEGGLYTLDVPVIAGVALLDPDKLRRRS